MDYNQLINKSIDQAADALGVVFAVNNKKNKQQLAKIQLDVQAVNSITTYHHVEDYLTSLSLVEKAIPLKVDGQKAVFEVTLRSSEEDFLNLIKNSAELIKVEPPKSPEMDPLMEIQVPELELGNSTEQSIDVLNSDEVTPEKNDASTPATNPLNPISRYYYRLNK